MESILGHCAEHSLGSSVSIAARVDSGKHIGIGHLTRMRALTDAFFSLYDVRADIFEAKDEPIDYRPYNIVILDSYLLSNDYIASIHSESQTLVCYDDNALYVYDCDIILNANLHASSLSFRTKVPAPVKFLGGDYALLRPDFWDAEPAFIRQLPTRVFVCFGGTDLNSQTPLVVNALLDIPDIQLSVVLGACAPDYPKLEMVVSDRLSIFRDPQSMAAIMQECDIAVISAGSITYEIASLGIPALTITQADNQRLVAEYLDNNALMKSLGCYDVLAPSLLKKETQDLLMDYKRRKHESLKLIKSVNKQGALKAAAAIWRIWDESSRQD